MIGASMKRALSPLVLLVLASCGEDPPVSVDAGIDAGGPLSCEEPQPAGCPDLDACDAGECLDLTLWECDETTGEWVDSGVVCEGVYVPAVGEIVLEQWVFSAGDDCPALRVRNPLVLSAHDDGSVTASAPVTILEGEAGGGFSQAYVSATLTDDWYGVTPTLAYEIWIGEDGSAAGQAAQSAPCDGTVEARGARCPVGVEPCGVFDDGWTAQCSSGAVYGDDLTRYAYCAPGSTVPACEVGGEGGLNRIATCSGACADTTVHSFATYEEYAAFDPTVLCVP